MKTRKGKIMSGYQVSHPKLNCYYNVVLTNDQFHQICNLLAEIGEGGKCKRMSDLPNAISFEYLEKILCKMF